MIIDCLIPIGRGQRELIIGDRDTGKTSLCLNTIINQKECNRLNSLIGYGSYRIFCIYVACGIKKSQIFNVQLILQETNSMWYSIIISAPSSVSCSIQYLSPFYGCSIGEYFRDNSLNALIIYDDLTNQAYSYRQMSLLIGRAPGREAYSGDIFYLHSRLLERSAKVSKKFGLGSLTALPIVETQEENISAYIPTNVISITDGQIYLSKSLFKNSILPAIDINKSISRIGSKAQTFYLSKISSSLKEILRNYFEISILLQTGQILNKRQSYQFTMGKAALGIWLQSEFQNVNYIEEYILCVLLMSEKICIKYPNAHRNQIKILYEKKENIWISFLINKSQNSSNLKLQNFINKSILKIFNNIHFFKN